MHKLRSVRTLGGRYWEGFPKDCMELVHINDLFVTVQGEGFHAGRRALFVRMPFCNLQCPFCDTQFNSFKEWDTQSFINFAADAQTKFAVITGGEPSMHKHTPVVIEMLKDLGYMIAMETNGMFTIPNGVDWVTVSPKQYQKIPWAVCEDAWNKASEVKLVVEPGFDWSIPMLWDNKPIMKYLSPEFGKMQENVRSILAFQARHPEWRLSLQTHKWIGVP